jgi:EmrB/QacA subfamily drug resistance transporter
VRSNVGSALVRSLLVESPRPARIREHPLAPWFVVATVSIGAFMGQLDASIVSIALPHIGSAFGAGPSVVVWVSLSYLLVLVCGLPVAGRFADRLGRKRLYVQGFIVFSVASAAGGLAPDLPLLIAARCLQGLGAALLQANSVALIREALSREQLGRGLGIQGAAQAVGLAGGPAIGGLLLAVGGWRLLFLVNIPAGAIGAVAGILLLPRSLSHRAMARFDWPGAVLLALAAGLLMVLVSLGREPSFTASRLAALAALGAAAAVALVVVERRAPTPLLNLALLRRHPLPAALASGFVAQTVLFGTLVAVPFDLAAHGTGSAIAGLELAALPVALAIAAPLAGRWSDRYGAHVLTNAGIAVAGIAVAALAVAHGVPERVVALAAAGAGLGAFVPVNNATVMRSAPVGHAGAMSGVLNMTRGMGTALGAALASLLYASAAGPGASGADDGLMVALLAFAAIAIATAAALAVAARVHAPLSADT